MVREVAEAAEPVEHRIELPVKNYLTHIETIELYVEPRLTSRSTRLKHIRRCSVHAGHPETHFSERKC